MPLTGVRHRRPKPRTLRRASGKVSVASWRNPLRYLSDTRTLAHWVASRLPLNSLRLCHARSARRCPVRCPVARTNVQKPRHFPSVRRLRGRGFVDTPRRRPVDCTWFRPGPLPAERRYPYLMMHSTTVLAVRHAGRSVMASDGQVTLGATVMKQQGPQDPAPAQRLDPRRLRRVGRRLVRAVHPVRGQARTVSRQPRTLRGGTGARLAHRPRAAAARSDARWSPIDEVHVPAVRARAT